MKESVKIPKEGNRFTTEGEEALLEEGAGAVLEEAEEEALRADNTPNTLSRIREAIQVGAQAAHRRLTEAEMTTNTSPKNTPTNLTPNILQIGIRMTIVMKTEEDQIVMTIAVVIAKAENKVTKEAEANRTEVEEQIMKNDENNTRYEGIEAEINHKAGTITEITIETTTETITVTITMKNRDTTTVMKTKDTAKAGVVTVAIVATTKIVVVTVATTKAEADIVIITKAMMHVITTTGARAEEETTGSIHIQSTAERRTRSSRKAGKAGAEEAALSRLSGAKIVPREATIEGMKTETQPTSKYIILKD